MHEHCYQKKPIEKNICLLLRVCSSKFNRLLKRSATRKQARKGFRPLSAMQRIGYFQNLGNFLRNCLEFFWILGGIFWEFFCKIFLEEFFGRDLLGRFFGDGFFWEEFFVYNVKVI